MNGEIMVQALVELGEKEDRVITIVKGKYGLKNKSEAMNLIIDEFEQRCLEPELRPEYRDELQKIDQGKFKRFNTIEELRKEIEQL